MSTQFYNSFIASSNKSILWLEQHNYQSSVRTQLEIKDKILNYDDLISYIEKKESQSKTYNYMMHNFIEYIKKDTAQIEILISILVGLISKRPINDLANSFLSIHDCYDDTTTIYVECLLYLIPKYEDFRKEFNYISNDDWTKYVFKYVKDQGFYDEQI